MKKPLRPVNRFPDEQVEARLFEILPEPPEYVRRYNVTMDWAYAAVARLGEVEEYSTRNPRLAGFRGTWVRDMYDDELAFEYGVPLERVIDIIPEGPRREAGGYRRIAIRLLTWVVDERHGGCYDPQWNTTGHGFTGRSATLAHYRYLRSYADAVSRGVESRRMVSTAIEILFWTQSANADDL